MGFWFWVWVFLFVWVSWGCVMGFSFIRKLNKRMNWMPSLYSFFEVLLSPLICCFLLLLTVPIWNSKVSLVFNCKKTCFWSSTFIFLLLNFLKIQYSGVYMELKLLIENFTVNWYLEILYCSEIVYLSWDQGRYDKDMKHNHQNSISLANFSSRLSTNKCHQLFREWHCFRPDVFLFRCTFW